MPPVQSRERRSDDEEPLNNVPLPPLTIDIGAVIRNVASLAQFGWYLVKTTIGALVSILTCVLTGILDAARVAGNFAHTHTERVLRAIGNFLTSPSSSFHQIFEAYVVPFLSGLGYWAGFLLVVGICAFVIYHIYNTLVERYVEDKFGFNDWEEQLNNLNLEPFVSRSIPDARNALTNMPNANAQ